MSAQYIVKIILALVNSTIHQDICFKEDCSMVDWERVYAIAERNMLIPLLYDPVKKLADVYNISEKLMINWKNTALGSMLLECEKYRLLRQVFSLAKKQKITFIVFKGCVLADTFPNYLSRVSCDTDILVYQRDREKAIELLESMGYHKDQESSKELVYVYIHDVIRHKIELHFSLWEDYKGSKIDLIEKMQLAKEESLIEINACGLEITTLGYNEHLIFQMFHIIKHFSLQGVSIRYLIDVTLYLNRYEEYIDFDEFWKNMIILSYDKFCENFFNICVQYLEMSPKILEGRQIRVTRNIEEFMTDLINVGSVSDGKKVAWQLLGTITPYFIGEQDIPNSRFRRKLQILFPASKNLPNEYVYARRHIMLLPFAWLHRWSYFLIKRHKHKKDWYDAKEMLAVAEHRLSLMRELGLVDGGNRL